VDTSDVLFLSLAVALAAVAAVLVAGRAPRDGAEAGAPDGSPLRGAAAALAFGLAYLAAHRAVLGVPLWGADEAHPFWIATLATAVALPLAALRARRAGWLAAAVLSAGIAALVIAPGAGYEWRESAGARWAGGGLLALASLAACLGAADRGRVARGPSWPMGWLVLAAATGVHAMRSVYAKYALASFAAAGVLLAAAVALCVRRRGRLGAGASLIASGVLATVLLGSFLHTLAADRAPSGAFVLLAAALLTHAAPSCACAATSPRRAALLRWAAVAALAAAALAWDALTWPGTSADGAGYDDYGE
jgi:hypothetical protein